MAKKTRILYLRVEVVADEGCDPLQENLSDVATWAEAALSSASVASEVTAYTELSALVEDQKAGCFDPASLD